MAWEQRGRSRYYTRSRRIGGRVRREYVGTGPWAELAAIEDRTERAERRRLVRARNGLLAKLDVARDLLRGFDERVSLLFRATLLAQGFHQHARGLWRRRRRLMATDQTRRSSETRNAERPATSQPTKDFDRADANRILGAATRGDASVLPRLRELLDRCPELWREAGDLAYHARLGLTKLAAGDNQLAAEAMLRRMRVLQAELEGDAPDPLERLLAERCAFIWAALYLAETDIAACNAANSPAVQKRLNALQARFDAAIKSLATVRRLLKPATRTNPVLKVVS